MNFNDIIILFPHTLATASLFITGIPKNSRYLYSVVRENN